MRFRVVFFYVDRPPGNDEVVTSTEVDRKVIFAPEKGQTELAKFSVSIGCLLGPGYGKLGDPAVGLEEIKECIDSGPREASK